MEAEAKAAIRQAEDMNQDELVELIMDMVYRMTIHNTLWFREVEHQLGLEKALQIMETAHSRNRKITMKRWGELLDFEVEDGVPKALKSLPRERLLHMTDEIGKNWLAVDGVWFQAVEFNRNMNDAKRCNDSTWGRFSPVEAWSIKRLLKLGDQPGLEGLERALNFRMYGRVNVQSSHWENPNSLIFEMNECRVQTARKRQKLDDYPCKSAGLVEYTAFAEAIDSRIKTECIGCPPDEHPEHWYCAWRFYIPNEA